MAHHAARTLRFTARTRSERGRAFTERILLAVTEVNRCALCAYGHSRLALKAGVGAGEIRALLGGVVSGVPDRELAAIVFAQHYADTRGHPDADAWRELALAYGEEQALGILGAVRMIMLGNAVGIPWSSLLSRLKGKPDPASTLRYEIGTIVGSHLVTPVALVHGGIMELRSEPAISFPPRHPATAIPCLDYATPEATRRWRKGEADRSPVRTAKRAERAIRRVGRDARPSFSACWRVSRRGSVP